MPQIKEGDKLPEFEFQILTEAGETATLSTATLFEGKKVVLFSVPGAFTPGCSKVHCPSFVLAQPQFKAKGVDTVAVLAVNDPFVMSAWVEHQGGKGKLVGLADPKAEFATKIGLDFVIPPWGTRSKRFSMLVDNGVVTFLAIDEEGIENTLAEKILAKL